jgi:hypothetical protein
VPRGALSEEFHLDVIEHALLALLLAAEEPRFSGGDGSSCDKAVVPLAIEGTPVVQAEHHWLRKTFGGGSLVRQALGASADGKRRYDVIVWRKPDGQAVEVCFDVTTVFEETIRRVEEEESGDSRRAPR